MLARDPQKGDALKLHEMGTAVRLERQLGISMTRSSQPGEDFRDNLGRSWDAIGSAVDDSIFDYQQFTTSLMRKLRTSAVSRIVVDLMGLGLQNTAAVQRYILTLDRAQQARIT